MNYRKKYKETFGDIQEGFEIHHIDFDRKNNDILNLVSMPIELHRQYHALLMRNDYFRPNVNIMPTPYSNIIKASDYAKLEDILREIYSFIELRDKIVFDTHIWEVK